MIHTILQRNKSMTQRLQLTTFKRTFFSKRILCQSFSITKTVNSANTSASEDSDGSGITSPINIDHLPTYFLRKSDPSYIDPSTYQRNDIEFDHNDGRPTSANVSGTVRKELATPPYQIQSLTFEQSAKMNGEETVANTTDNENGYHKIHWQDGHTSKYTDDWVTTQLRRLQMSSTNKQDHESPLSLSFDLSPVLPRLPWSNLTEEEVRSSQHATNATSRCLHIPFEDIIHKPDKMKEAVRILYQHGILLVSSTPTDDKGAGIAALASAISGPDTKSETTLFGHYHKEISASSSSTSQPLSFLEHATDGPAKTMYGNIWSTHSSDMADGTTTADTAYGNGALPLHTDMTYYRNPPGLQIFTMCIPAEFGGESVFGDGLAIAEYMRKYHWREFDILCRTTRRYRSIDQEVGWYLQASGPVIQAVDNFENVPLNALSGVDPEKRWGPVLGIRHNDLDRLPDLPPRLLTEEKNHSSIVEFYEDLAKAHKVWDDLLGKDEFRLVVKMEPGDTMVVANQRCFHGRCGFNSSKGRSVMGCYVSQDDLDSRFRWMMDGYCNLE